MNRRSRRSARLCAGGHGAQPDGLLEIDRAMSKPTPGPWEWWTSNSWRRLRSNPANGRDVGVCVPFVASDGHPDLEVSAADMTLIAAAPDLLALARQYADECAECGGNGVVWTNPHDPQDAIEVPCEQCADIRAVIAKAEGRA